MKKTPKAAFFLVLGVLLVIIDQVIKVLVKTNMDLGEQIFVIGQWFRLCFVENEGMAFGMAFGGKVGKLLLTIFRIVLSGLLIWWIASMCRKNRKAISQGIQAPVPVGVLVGLTLITAGAIGNVIDCLFYGIIWDYAPLMFGRVVDMFYFPLIDTIWPSWVPFVGGDRLLFFAPVFNFADSCVTVGAFYLILFQNRFFTRAEEKPDEKK